MPGHHRICLGLMGQLLQLAPATSDAVDAAVAIPKGPSAGTICNLGFSTGKCYHVRAEHSSFGT